MISKNPAKFTYVASKGICCTKLFLDLYNIRYHIYRLLKTKDLIITEKNNSIYKY